MCEVNRTRDATTHVFKRSLVVEGEQVATPTSHPAADTKSSTPPPAAVLPDAKALQLTDPGSVDAKSFARSTGTKDPQLLQHGGSDPRVNNHLADATTGFAAPLVPGLEKEW